MTSNFDILFEAIITGKTVSSTDDILFNESLTTKMADWADALQKGWNYISGKTFRKNNRTPRNYEVDTPALLERKAETEKIFQQLSKDLFAYNFDTLTMDDVHSIRLKAQDALDKVVALHVDDDVANLKTRVDKIVGQYISAQNTARGDQPGDMSVHVPGTSTAMADDSYPPEEKEVPETFKTALAKAKEILGMKYDIQDKEVSWGNKLIMLMMVFGLANNIKFD